MAAVTATGEALAEVVVVGARLPAVVADKDLVPITVFAIQISEHIDAGVQILEWVFQVGYPDFLEQPGFIDAVDLHITVAASVLCVWPEGAFGLYHSQSHGIRHPVLLTPAQNLGLCVVIQRDRIGLI